MVMPSHGDYSNEVQIVITATVYVTEATCVVTCACKQPCLCQVNVKMGQIVKLN